MTAPARARQRVTARAPTSGVASAAHTGVSGGPGGGGREARRARRSSWIADLAGGSALATLVFVVALWLANGGLADLGAPGELALTAGRLTGLLAADLLLLQVLLMARIPFVERAWGQDVLTRRHRLIGHLSCSLMLAHVVLIVIGYTRSGNENLAEQTWDLIVNYPGMVLALAGTLALVAVVVTSIRAARRRLRYESWHLIHLYAYLGVGLALPHELWTGADFLASPAATVFWWVLWASAAAALVAFRVVLPLSRSMVHRLTVERVIPEAPGVLSVVMCGRHLRWLPARPGQFFQWRFLDGPGWSRAHPFSMSAVPRGDRLRITARTDGDDGSRLARLRPGTRVLLEGPYGVLTADRRRHRDVLLLAAGVGITPIRGLAEQIAAEPAAPGPGGARPPSVVLLHRISTPDDVLFGRELADLASGADIRLGHLVGPRDPAGCWLPAAPLPGDPAQLLRALVPDLADREVYLCGPAGWMAAVCETLRALGVARSSVHREAFAL